ncbi:hypothetical protein [Novosphingobium lentum]|uniref:hypothetical protein n=1 Tax=Novosphingobium lentum TaxID=145287 RepID=UPI0008360C3E|nr:hypothetical protein [Novosphingobium lentum]
MTDAPETANPTADASNAATDTIDWQDHASVRRRESEGVLGDFAILNQGTFAEMVAYVAHLPAIERAGLVVEKAGDRRFDAAEVAALARRPDFPG